MQKEITIEQFLQMEIHNISQVYMGRDRCCRCGCGGTYTATSFMQDPRSDVDDRLVNTRLTRAKRIIQGGGEYDLTETYINIPTGRDRCLTFYFDELK